MTDDWNNQRPARVSIPKAHTAIRDACDGTRGELQDMKAMFANLTAADFRRRSPKELRAVERRRVHVLFEEIQVAIHNDDRTKIDYLMAELAEATADEHGYSSTVRLPG